MVADDVDRGRAETRQARRRTDQDADADQRRHSHRGRDVDAQKDQDETQADREDTPRAARQFEGGVLRKQREQNDQADRYRPGQQNRDRSDVDIPDGLSERRGEAAEDREREEQDEQRGGGDERPFR